MRAFFVLKFAGVGFSSYLCRSNEDATAIAVGNLTRGICGGASRWGQDLTRKSQATLRQYQTPVRGESSLAGIIGLEDLHALLEEGVLVVLDEGSADAESFLFGAAGDQADS